jgi:hypothetical protein
MPRVRCAACKVLNCFKHRTLWHRGSTCEDIDNNAAAGAEAAEAATLEVIQANCKACPGKIQATGTVCGTMIMKNGGCIHMTCEYSWIHCKKTLDLTRRAQVSYAGRNGVGVV